MSPLVMGPGAGGCRRRAYSSPAPTPPPPMREPRVPNPSHPQQEALTRDFRSTV